MEIADFIFDAKNFAQLKELFPPITPMHDSAKLHLKGLFKECAKNDNDSRWVSFRTIELMSDIFYFNSYPPSILLFLIFF